MTLRELSRTKASTRAAGALAAVLLGVPLTSCSASKPDPHGPIQFGGDQGSLCFMLEPGRAMLTGDQAAAPSDTAVTLLSLEVAESSGLVLDDAFVLPDEGPKIGSARYQPDDARWAVRTPLAGTLVEPGGSAWIAAVLRRVGQPAGHAAALTLTYSTGERVFVRSNTTRYDLDDTCE